MAAVDVSEDRNAVHLTVRGVVDRSAINELKAVLARHSARAPKQLVLDLREVSDFQRLGLGLLVAGHQMLGDRLRVACNAAVRELIEETGLARVLTLTATVALLGGVSATVPERAASAA